MTLPRWLTFLLRSQTVIRTVLLFWIYLSLLMLVFVLQRLSLHWKILIMLFSQFLLTQPSYSQWDVQFHHIAYAYSYSYAIPPLFNGLEVLSSTSHKAKLFAENFSKNSNLDDSGISLPVLLSRTNLKLHYISVTPKMVKKVIMNLDLSKATGPDCIPVVVLKNCEPELSYILAELFNKCLKESCFPDWWKVSSAVPIFENVGERSTAKSYHPVSLLFVVSKVVEKLANNRLVDHLD